MKYDLKAMKFVPDESDIDRAFLWVKTPEGADYWNNQCENGITPEGQAKWDAMKQQWNEENGVIEREVGTARDDQWSIVPPNTPQRYVVLTDDDTIICTRAEAEDLAAGGVDAVYKLGDKVEVTVKVEFE